DLSPISITVPLPNCLSIWARAAVRARFLFSSIVEFLGSLIEVMSNCKSRRSHGLRRVRRGHKLADAGRIGQAEIHRHGCPAKPRRARVAMIDRDRHRLGLTRPQYRPSIAKS